MSEQLPTMREITAAVAARHGVEVEAVLRTTGWSFFTPARREAMAACYATGRFTNLQVARRFNLSDHSAVVNARQRVAAMEGAD